MNTENNKLLAEFMGLSKTKMFFNLKTGNYVKIETDECEVRPTEVYLKNNRPITSFYYHSDWNWLMEVAEKIESLSKEQKVINFSRQNKSIFDFKLTESKIEATYNACVEFVKWYNEQK